jgi:hypothetical protein
MKGSAVSPLAARVAADPVAQAFLLEHGLIKPDREPRLTGSRNRRDERPRTLIALNGSSVALHGVDDDHQAKDTLCPATTDGYYGLAYCGRNLDDEYADPGFHKDPVVAIVETIAAELTEQALEEASHIVYRRHRRSPFRLKPEGVKARRKGRPSPIPSLSGGAGLVWRDDAFFHTEDKARQEFPLYG